MNVIKQSDPFYLKIFDFVVRRIQIQSSQHILSTIPLLIPQILNTVILSIMILLVNFPSLINCQISLVYLYIPLIFRATLVIIYVLSQKIIFYNFNKVSLVITLILFKNNGGILHVGIIIIQMLINSGIWVLNKQQRVINIYSRYNLFPLWCKQIIIGILICIYSLLNNSQQHKQFVFIALLFYLYQNFSEIIYQKIVYNILIGLNIWIIINFIISYFLPISYSNFLIVMVLNLLIIIISIINTQQLYDILYKIPLKNLQKIQQNQLLLYFLLLINLQKSKNYQQIQKFIIYHKNQCHDLDCVLFYSQKSNNLNQNQMKILLLKGFIQRQLIISSKGRKKIQKLLIYYLSPSQKVYRYLNKNILYQRKQFIRLQKSRNSQQDCDIKLAEIQISNNQIKNNILKFLNYKIKFCKNLLELKVDCLSTLQFGINLLDQLQIIKDTKNNNENYSSVARELINIFMNYLMNLQQKYLQQQQDPPYLTKRSVQSNPILMISAQGPNFTQIIEANIATVKLTYYRKQQILQLKIRDLVPNQIKEVHQKSIQQCSRRSDFTKALHFKNSLFFKNKIGYSVCFSAIISPLNAISGRKWCFSLLMGYQNEAIIIVGQNRKIMGVNQYCLTYGISKNIQGKHLTQQIFNKLQQNPQLVHILKRHQNLLEDDDFCYNQKLLIKQRQSVFYHIKYYMIQINVAQSKTRKVLNQQKISNFKINSFKFYRKNDGSITNWQDHYQTQQQQLLNFKQSFPQFYKKSQRKQNWGQGITQMRLLPGNMIDFVENIEIQQFQQVYTTQKQKIDQINFQITQQFYQETLETRKIKLPTWILILRSTFVIYILGSLTLLSLLYVKTSTCISNNKIQLQTAFLSSDLLYKLVSVGFLPVLQHYNTTININKQIKNQLTQIQFIFSNLSYIQPQISKIVSQTISQQSNRTLSSLQSQLKLLLNNYINNNNQSLNQILDLLIQNIFPARLEFIQQLQDQYNNRNNNRLFQLKIISGILIILSCLFLIIIIIIIRYINYQEIQMFKILINIKNYLLQQQLLKILKFSQYLYFNTDIQDQQFAIQQNQQKISNQQSDQQPKKIINQPSRKYIILIIFFWIVVIIILSIAIISQNINYILFQNNQKEIVSQLYGTLASANMLWVGLNRFPDDLEVIDSVERHMYQSQTKSRSFAVQSFNLGYFSVEFNIFYQQFFCEDSCQYLKTQIPTCQTDLNGVLKEGIQQIFAILQRNFDFLMHHQYQKQQFIQYKAIPILIDIQYKYFPYIGTMVKSKISNQNLSYYSFYQNYVLILYIIGIVVLLLSSICYKLISSQHISLLKLETVISLIPFKYLIKIRQFKKYTQQKISAQIY